MRVRTVSLVAIAVAALIAAIAIAVAPAFGTASSHSAGSKAAAVTKPPVVMKFIAYGAARKQQTTAYCRRHYGARQATYLLTDPKAIVLHHTDGADWQSAWNTFNSNTPYITPTGKEKPGVSAQFIIAKDGTIYQLMPLTYRARHCIGMNYIAFGIEFCQESAGHSGHWMDQQILNRTAQVDAGLRLVRWLQYRYGIKTGNVVGHATANSSPYFMDKTGIRNGAGDWFAPELNKFKARL